MLKRVVDLTLDEFGRIDVWINNAGQGIIRLPSEIQEQHPDIRVSLVSPGVVRTDFGLSALHGGPDSRQFPESQCAEEVAAVIAEVIDSQRQDVYTRAGMRDRVLAYYEELGTEP